MSLYSWSIKESNCSLCWVGSSSASQAWTHWLRELESNREKEAQTGRISWAESRSRAEQKDERRGFTSCRCPGRWFPQEQTGRGNLLGQTTAMQSYLYWSMSCDPFHSQVRGQGELQHHHHFLLSYWMSAFFWVSHQILTEISFIILARFLRENLYLYSKWFETTKKYKLGDELIQEIFKKSVEIFTFLPRFKEEYCQSCYVQVKVSFYWVHWLPEVLIAGC